ncbi:HlyD family type I secretion periplasmic adaptor subunit [Thiothrix nivea]|uniref:Membrane fusion protein (MFP) family protein n=1 Tax=Thiothrix nivea (strain ATCC 35100 / DSM 5205 / JP2) TaxID=870187 RepID=A0A656HFS8_THINJ|nr:HlyD family type I secretion periplasmic adaptor subunit [Thiothrix nivea]EIJ34250.1 type I secretion membrane fusion protein, HlyD family [Thiothrix nivea DSM 5205]
MSSNGQALATLGTIGLPADSVAGIELPKNESPYRFLGGLMLFITFVVMGGWAAFAPLDSAVVTVGKVIVASQNKKVQHLDGGIVKEINVHDGDLVKAGQPLLVLDDTQLRAQLDNTNGQLWETEASLERLAAERDGREALVWDAGLEQTSRDNPVLQEILKTQNELFSARRQAFVSEKSVLAQRLAQSNKQIGGLEEELQSLGKRRTSLGEDLGSLNKLVAREMVAKSLVRQNERDYEEIKGDIARSSAEVARLNDVVAETQHQMVLRREEYLKEISSSISELQAKQIQLKSQQAALQDKLGRLVIDAPVTGRVKGFELTTLGAVIGPGSLIMEVVPTEQAYKVIAEVSPQDIDVLVTGQAAEVKFSIFDDARYFPTIFANLIDVSADTLVDEKSKASYYKATLAIQEDSMKVLDEKGLSLVAGMPAEVFLETGERTLLDYLIKPLRDMVERAFNEA